MDNLYRELLLVAKDSELAFNGFMHRFSNVLYCHAYGILGSREMAEEVVSDTFFEAWKTRKHLVEMDNVRGWLSRVVYRKSVDYLRREKKRLRPIHVEDFGIEAFSFPDMCTPCDTLISSEELSAINAAIETLPPKCKYVFFLAKVERLPYQEIAEMLSISLSTVNYHVNYALQALKNRLLKQHDEERQSKKKER
jgi:RNA polymerase sigma factor, sigma-70 family